MTWLEYIGTAATIIAIVGVVLNNSRRRQCFILWFASNGMTLAIHLSVGVWSLAARDAVFLVLAVHGWFMWGRKNP